MTSTTEVKLAGGRRVAVYEVAGGARGKTVVLCHAALGAGDFDPDPEATATAGVTLISLDRPAYGGSDPVRGDPAPDEEVPWIPPPAGCCHT